MGKKENQVRIYLILVLIIGVLGLLDSLLTIFNLEITILYNTLALIFFVFSLFNILVIAYFIYLKVKKKYFILPIYFILSYLILFIIGMFLVMLKLMNNMTILLFSILGILTSTFEMVFAYYLLEKLLDEEEVCDNDVDNKLLN